MKEKKNTIIQNDLDLVFNSLPALAFSQLANTSFLLIGSGFTTLWCIEFLLYLKIKHGITTSVKVLSKNIEKAKLAAPHLFSQDWIQWKSGDIRKISELPIDVDWVINTAGDIDTRNHATDPITVSDTIVGGLQNIFQQFLLSDRLKKILHLSSGLVYGNATHENGFLEEQPGLVNSIDSSNIYVEAKRYSESLCSAYRASYRLPIVVMRPFNFVGPYQNLNHPLVICDFLRESISKSQIKIVGDGQTIRTYLYGADVAHWMIRFLLQAEVGSVLNLGSDEKITTKELATLISKHTNSSVSQEIRIQKNKMIVKDFTPNLHKAKNMYNLKQVISLDKALENTIEWNRK